MGTLVAVTGANGFVGHHLVEALLAENCEVRAVVRRNSETRHLPPNVQIVEIDDITSKELKGALAGADRVIHCAAQHVRSVRKAAEIIETNLKGTENVIRSLGSVDKFVLLSSYRTMLNRHRKGAIDESVEYDFKELDNPYGYSKYLSEKLCLDYVEKERLPAVIVNPTAIIGPKDYGPSPNGKLILDVIQRKVCPYIDTTNRIVDVRDVAKATMLLMEKGGIGERYALCGGNFSLKDYFAEIFKCAGVKKPMLKIPMPMIMAAAIFFEGIEKTFRSFKPPVVKGSIETAMLRNTVNTAKVESLGFSFRNPEITIKETVAWLMRFHLNSV